MTQYKKTIHSTTARTVEFEAVEPPKPPEPIKRSFTADCNYAVIHGDGSGVIAIFAKGYSAAEYASLIKGKYATNPYVVCIHSGQIMPPLRV